MVVLPENLAAWYRKSDPCEDPALDAELRKVASVPCDRYYSVLFRQDGKLVVSVDYGRTRRLTSQKISKSDQ